MTEQNPGKDEKAEEENFVPEQMDPALAEHLKSVSSKISHAARLGGKKNESLDLIKKQEEEIAQLKDSMLRLAADKENTIKRMEKQISDTGKYAISSFLKDLLPAIDNLYRAGSSINQTAMSDNSLKILYDGIELTKNNFTKIFEKHGLIRIEPKAGDDFDHNYHQAVATVSDSNIENGKIAAVMQSGYELSGRLIRAAMVTVVKNS